MKVNSKVESKTKDTKLNNTFDSNVKRKYEFKGEKRKRKIVTIILISLLGIFAIFVLIKSIINPNSRSLALEGVVKNASIDISGLKSEYQFTNDNFYVVDDALEDNNKYYTKDTNLLDTDIGVGTVFVNGTDPLVKIKTTFPVGFYPANGSTTQTGNSSGYVNPSQQMSNMIRRFMTWFTRFAKKVNKTTNSYRIGVVDKDGNQLSLTDCSVILNSTDTDDIKIPSDAVAVKTYVYNNTLCRSIPSTKTLKVVRNVVLTGDSKGITKNSNGHYVVDKPGNYDIQTTITNPSVSKLYYRAITFKTNEMSEKNIDTDSKCLILDTNKIVDGKILIDDIDFKDRIGYVKVYANENNCKNDDYGLTDGKASSTGTKILYIASIPYRYRLRTINTTYQSVDARIIIGDKSFAKNTDISEKDFVTKQVYASKDGNNEIKIKIDAPDITVDTNKYYYQIVQLDVKGNKIDSNACQKVTKDIKDEKITISKNNNSVQIRLYNTGSCSGDAILVKKIAITPLPIMSISYDGKDLSFGEQIAVPILQTYTSKVKITNDGGYTYYYRIFKFNGDSWSNPTDKTACEAVNGSATKDVNIELTTQHQTIREYVRAYATKELCEGDSDANYDNDKSIQYVMSYAALFNYSASGHTADGFKRVDYDITDIQQKIGKQLPSQCYDYSAAYGLYMLTGVVKIGYYSGAATTCSVGDSASSKAELNKIIKENIDNGLPVVVHGYSKRVIKSGTKSNPVYDKSKDAQHYVLVVGYNTNNKNVGSWGLDDLWVIDPYTGHDEVMSDSVMRFYPHDDLRYNYWKSKADAMRCKNS